MTSTRFTDLVGCREPLQLAGMGIVANVDLAAAVADAGGLGMLALPEIPAPVFEAGLDELASRTSGRFGVNFLMPFLDLDCVKVASGRAHVLEWFYGDPDPALVAIAHDGGSVAGWQVGSAAEAVAAVEAGCDYVVAQGIEAGGHVRGQASLWSVLGEVLDAVAVPVVAAGGLGTARAVAAAFAAGADAVRIGTRFVAAVEADAHPDYQAKLLEATAADTELTTAFSVDWPDAPHRVLRSSIEAALAHEDEIVGEIIFGDVVFPVPRLSSAMATRDFRGAAGATALYAGHSVDGVHGVQPAAEIVAELLSLVPA
jgi:NAD(P)H-dependent flavin oxidoreductase YrpB (nitropropane dioxygenase family)